MCSTHEVYCKICGKKLAWWSVFDNVQYADEYQCSAAIENKTNRIIMDDVVQDDAHLKKLRDILKRERVDVYDKKDKKLCLERNWSYCNNLHETHFCESCARKLNYKCSVCGGKIVIERRA